MARTLTIWLEAGTPRLGIWCDHCLTSAGYEIDVYMFGHTEAWILKTIRGCRRCDGHDDA